MITEKIPQYNTEKLGMFGIFQKVRYRDNGNTKITTQKLVALLERIIKASSNEGDLVLDPFSGTFTTSFCSKITK